MSEVKWHKSSYSGDDGSMNCVEVAVGARANVAVRDPGPPSQIGRYAVSHFAWHKSSHSNLDRECIEVSTHIASVVAIRDSKDPDGPQLAFAPEAWSTFIDSVRGGEFAPR